MKKTVSISINRVLFHIEEDGYEKLKTYLTSIHHYFSSYDDHHEIIEDIENRIAEILSAKLPSPTAVVTSDDIDHLIKTMGTTLDFKKSEETYPKTDTAKENKRVKKRLYRDKKNKIIAGVASGLANYLSIDPLIIRIAWVVLLIGSSLIKIINLHAHFSLSISLGGISLLTYIILWIAIPEVEQLEDHSNKKKLFRNAEAKTIGGVASGLADYFQLDIALVRILFVLSIFLGGGGIIFYIILWVITPEAKTVTEKMQMQGEPITLSNIADNIKNDTEKKNESNLAQVLLFPFRILGKILRPIGQLTRIFIGMLLIIIGLTTMVGLVIGWSALFGLVSGEVTINDISVPFTQDLLTLPVFIFSFILLFAPFLGLFIAGISMIKRRLASLRFLWILMGLWLISIGGFVISAVPQLKKIRYEEKITKESVFDIKNNKCLHFILNEGENKHGYKGLKINIVGYEGKQLKLVETYSARGSSSEDAIHNTKEINYPIKFNDSIITLNDRILFNSSSYFRAQYLSLTIYIPYHQRFYLDSSWDFSLDYEIDGSNNLDDITEHTWVFTEKKLNCIDCK